MAIMNAVYIVYYYTLKFIEEKSVRDFPVHIICCNISDSIYSRKLVELVYKYLNYRDANSIWRMRRMKISRTPHFFVDSLALRIIT